MLSDGIDYKGISVMTSKRSNDVAELTKLSLSTFLNIGQMARYRYLYTLEKELKTIAMFR